MIRSRAGWKIVTLLVVLLLLRAVAATIMELKIASGGFVAFRIVCLAGWIAILFFIGIGFEWARFAAVMILSLGTAVAAAILLDRPLLQDRLYEGDIALLRTDLLIFISTNLVFVPLLAFCRPVRSFFARVPNVQLPAPPPPPASLPAGARTVLPQIRVASETPARKVPPPGAAEWRQVNPARSERKQR